MSWFTKIFGHKQENPYSPAELPERQEEKLPAAIESTTNLVPNTVVPKSGLYTCNMCRVLDSAMRKSKSLGDYAQQKCVDSEVLAGILRAAITQQRYKAGECFGECPNHKNDTVWTLEPEEVPSTSTPVVKPVTRELPMMECPPFPGNASCSDNDCPCPNTTMPPAKGYLWVKPEVADTRMKCLSLAALNGYMTASGISSIDEIRRRCLPIVVCEQAAKRRNLDMEVAASDYGSWVKTGKVPCRATPLVSSESAPAINIRSSSAPTLNIGDEYGGGIIFYIDATKRRGLIAAKEDLSGDFNWDDANIECKYLVSNGYSDWFLPNKEQLNQLYLQRSAVGGFSDDYYWSSTEISANLAWFQGFVIGYQDGYYKDYRLCVRAVRAFNY